MYAVLLENRAHRFVAADLTSVAGILKFMLADIRPDFLYRLGSRKLGEISCFSIKACG